MSGHKMRSTLLSLVLMLFLQQGSLLAETWRLDSNNNWRLVSGQRRDDYLLAVSKIKQLISDGQTENVQNSLLKLKKDFPEIAGPDLDAFLKAEVFFCQGKFTRAVKSYDTFLTSYPRSNLYDAALDREFAIATAFLAGQKRTVLRVFRISRYDEGIKIMEKITDRAGDAPIAARAAVAIAEHYEKRGKFNDAYYQWSLISSRWPTGRMGKDALLAMARCKHAAFKGTHYSDADLISAKTYYENFKDRYPDDAEKIGLDKILKQIDEELAYKQLDIAQYYRRTENLQSANLYYQMVVDNWPETNAAKMAREFIAAKYPPDKKVRK